MQHFKNKPENIIEILLQHLWLNKYICINNNLIYYKNYEKKRIIYVKDLLNNNCQFLDYITLNEKYDIRASFLDIIQIRSSIPIEWKETLKQCSLMPKSIPSGNIIKINNKMKAIEKVTCNLFYWHFINIDVHNPS